MFIEKPASNNSLSNRRPVCGVGINDANYTVQPRINGSQVSCPYYQKWQSMIKRCYSQKIINKHPTYKGCFVCDEWLVFSVFKDWMVKQDWQGKELDKDILIQGNKIYSPETCLFVSARENTIKASAKKFKFISPQGVIVEVYNLTGFCRDNELDQPTMCKLNKGKENQHKGWLRCNDE